MLTRKLAMSLSVILGLICIAPAQGAGVRAWEGTLRIPTYLLGPEDPNPPFPLVNHNDIYPYPALDDLTDQRETKTYRAIYLENKYLRATILPQMDGRVYSLYDKVAKREVLYRNHVVKYGLVGLRGAWISGGIEFNFPNGHTTDTVSPVASRFRQNPDGSATVVVGDMDQVSGMHWEVALTMRPGVARLEQHVTLFNSTPLAKLYWWWANAAVPARKDMQFIYPMRLVNPHSPTQVWTYPLWKGVDYSWYKDVRRPTSLFGVGVHRSFFGAYYHQSDDGVIHVADYHEVPGKKTWTWGVAGDGLIWTHLLTDDDGPYNEIQAGHFETQLSQEFLPPQRVESWTEYWYPVGGLGSGFVEGTPQMALNVIYPSSGAGGDATVELAVSPAVILRDAKVQVKLGAKMVKDFAPVSFEPLVTRTFSIPAIDVAAARRRLDVKILNPAGQTVLHWFAGAPVDGNPEPLVKPGVQKINQKPDHELSTEKLFLRGVNAEKARRPLEAGKIYREALKRVPGYVPALLKLAAQEYLAADFASAEGLVVRAQARDAEDPRVEYLAGVIYKGAGKSGLAEDALWSAIRFGGTEAPALIELAEISIRQKEYGKAIELLRRALNSDPKDGVALSDLAAGLRLAGHPQEASRVVRQALGRMPILSYALAEHWRVEAAMGDSSSMLRAAEVLKNSVGYRSQAYLETGAWYRALGDLASSDFVLQAALKNLAMNKVSPLIYDYLAANAWDKGESGQAETWASKAMKANVKAVFPNRPEDAVVLRDVLAHNPTDAHVQYFLGNFLFAHGHYVEAADLWKHAAREGFEYSVLYRNLGVYAWKVQDDPQSAAGYYVKAIKEAPEDFRLYVDLDEIYTQLGQTRSRESLFASTPPNVLGRDSVRARRVLLDVEEGHYDQALDLLKGHNFKPSEGGKVIRKLFVLVHLEKGRRALAAGQFKAADEAFRSALEYPVNLGVGKPDNPQNEAALYWLGRALEAQGEKSAANDAWKQAVEEAHSAEGESEENRQSSSKFYAALALNRLGDGDAAARILNGLASEPAQARKSAYDYYLAGLVESYRQRFARAIACFHHALELDPELWQARVELRHARAAE